MSKRMKIVKKRTNKFRRFETDRHKAMNVSWRHTRGIDCMVRRRYKGALRMPKIGYASNKRTRHLLPNHLKKFVVHNVSELDLLMMNSDKYTAEIGKNVGAPKRIQILRRAKELNVKVTNQKSAKITKLEEKLKKHATK